jgi:hypothetical protein
VKNKSSVKAKEMAKLELANWNEKHENDLIKDFGFTPDGVRLRKISLQKQALCY